MDRLAFDRTGVVLLLALFMAGCAGFRSSLSDKRLIYNISAEISSLLIAGEVDKVMEYISEAFTHEQWQDKDGLRRFLTAAAEAELMAGARMDTSETSITIEGDRAIVYPIGLSAPLGDATVRLVYGREAGTWKVVSLELKQL